MAQNDKPKSRPFVGIILCGIVFLLTGINVYNDFAFVYAAFRSPHWAVVDGAIIWSSMSQHEDSDSGVPYYSPEVGYAYFFNSNSYVGSQIKFAAMNSSRKSRIQAILDRYPVKQPVKIYCNPRAPNQSVLEPGFSVNSWHRIILGLISLGLCAACGWICFGRPVTKRSSQDR
jgi:hypothetical protein